MDNAFDLPLEIYSADAAITSSGAGYAVGKLIPDRYLYRAVGACCTDDLGRLVTKPIRGLIARYAPDDPPTVNEIPQERRRKFLNELSSITGRTLPPFEPIGAHPILTSPDVKTIVEGEAISTQPALAGQDGKQIAYRYEPIAVNGKAAVAKGWNTQPSTVEAITGEHPGHPGAKSAGRPRGADITHPPSNFLKYIGTPFQYFILPIIPAGAELKKESTLTPDYLGKIPGKWSSTLRKWTGFYAWQNNLATQPQLELWQGWQGPDQCDTAIAIGMRTEIVCAADFDINNDAVAVEARIRFQAALGLPGAVRRRYGSARSVLVYLRLPRSSPITKSRLAFKILATGEECAIEFLGHGQQVVIEGPHAKGAMHYWEDNHELIDSVDKLLANVITIDHVDRAMRQLKDWVDGDERFERINLSRPSMSDRAAASISDIMSPNYAKDQGLLKRAVQAISLDDPSLHYEAWIKLMRAICAACAGDMTFFTETGWPWSCTQTVTHGEGPRTEDRGIEWLKAKWRSFRDSQLGADYVYGIASQFKFTEGLDARLEVFADRPLPEEISGTAADSGLADAGDASATAMVPPGSGGAQGGPVPPNDTHRALAQDFMRLFSSGWKWCIDSRRWYSYQPTGVWEIDETIVSQIGAYLATVSRQILARVPGQQGAARSRALESVGVSLAVERLLKSEPGMIVEEKHFDAQPHLLNTPDYVVDLRTGQTLPHAPELLMRQQTLVSPNPDAFLPWEKIDDPVAVEEHLKRWTPRFYFTLKNLDGTNCTDNHIGTKLWFIKAIGGIYGYMLIGEVRHAGIFFLEGPPGIGKTQAWEVLYLILRTYGEQIFADFISKNGEGHRFDLGRIAGKRMLFLDETMMGMLYDEARMSLLASGSTLTVEIKFGRDSVKFPNRAKLCISGNHRPHFISGEAGGLSSRMMLFEAQGEYLRGGPKDIHNVAALIAQEEGPAILTWAIQNAVLDYQDGGHQRFHELMAPAKAATKEYTRQDSTIVQWADEHVQFGADCEPDFETDLIDLYKSFKEYAKDANDMQRLRPQDFKRLLMAAFPELKADKRGRPNIGRVFLKGIAFKAPVDAVGNVVEFPAMPKPKEN
jgi:phage/plasmid-associated DNA primase